MKDMRAVSTSDRTEAAIELIRSTVPDANELLLVDLERVRFWIQEILRTDSERLDWHIKRLQGIGASEVGTLVRELVHQERGGMPGVTAGSIILQKLLLAPLKRPTFAMRSGTLHEADAKALLIEQAARNGGVVDHDATRLLRLWSLNRSVREKVGKGLELLVGEDDLILKFGDKRILYDIKVDSNRNGGPVAEEYIYQLHSLALICEEGLGLPIHGMRISRYGPDDEGYPSLENLIVHREEYRFGEIREAARIAWDYRAKGTAPMLPPKKYVRLENAEEIKTIAEYSNEYFSWMQLYKLAEDKKEEARKSLVYMANQVSLDHDMSEKLIGSQGTLRVGLLNIGFSTEANLQEVAENLLAEKAIDSLDKLRKPVGSVNEDKLVRLLQEVADQRAIPLVDLIAELRDTDWSQDEILTLAKQHYGENPIPGIYQSYRLSEIRTKDTGLEDCKMLARTGLEQVAQQVRAQAEISFESSISKPAKVSANEQAKREAKKAEKSPFDLKF